jgi:hypothetical protein
MRLGEPQITPQPPQARAEIDRAMRLQNRFQTGLDIAKYTAG